MIFSKKQILIRSLYALTISVSMNACSNNAGVNATTTFNSNVSKKSMPHSHPANKCIDAINHSHADGEKKHQHHYHSCAPKSVKSNAHTHPSKSSVTGFFRHVHPNGSNEHSHTR